MANVAIQQAFIRLGIPQDAAHYLVQKQGLSSIEVLRTLTSEMITQTCKKCAKPVGSPTMAPAPAPAIRPATRNAPVPDPVIANPNYHPGYEISVYQESLLQFTVFFVKHRYMTSRPVTPEDITLSSVVRMRNLKLKSDSWTAPDIDKPEISPTKVFDFFEEFAEYLNKFQGSVSKRPLGYVVRKSAAVLPHDTDPPVGAPLTVYNNHTSEIEARAPIFQLDPNGNMTSEHDNDFIEDNEEVWDLLWSIVRPTTYASHIKKHQKSKDLASNNESDHGVWGPRKIDGWACG